MATPDFRMGVNTAKKKQLRCSATADENYAGLMPHDLRNQFRTFGIGKGPRAVEGKRRQGSVVVEQQGAGRGRAQLLEESPAHVRMFGDSHSNSALDSCEH